MTRFQTPDAAATAVLLQGWTVLPAAAEGVLKLLIGGPVPGAFLAPADAGVWTTGHRPDPRLPLGPPTAVVTVDGPEGSEVEIAMGGPGSAQAPTDGIRTWTVRLGAGERLVLDARSWFRSPSTEITAQLWTAFRAS
ncbi:hypothetical protein IPZ64_02375 [Streptomyces violaceoruber]|uniref:hypothetical protein n=1 Tax=Streptomyces violaceoruber TaxID=1935 RepID=UPI001F1BBF5E|nr:hypothetical protein [Streptomyces violaceoruber]MCF3165781.1 hypothetical protein [Streptomyces violaceoruber]